jgi:hypothetical protein
MEEDGPSAGDLGAAGMGAGAGGAGAFACPSCGAPLAVAQDLLDHWPDCGGEAAKGARGSGGGSRRTATTPPPRSSEGGQGDKDADEDSTSTFTTTLPSPKDGGAPGNASSQSAGSLPTALALSAWDTPLDVRGGGGCDHISHSARGGGWSQSASAYTTWVTTRFALFPLSIGGCSLPRVRWLRWLYGRRGRTSESSCSGGACRATV